MKKPDKIACEQCGDLFTRGRKMTNHLICSHGFIRFGDGACAPIVKPFDILPPQDLRKFGRPTRKAIALSKRYLLRNEIEPHW